MLTTSHLDLVHLAYDTDTAEYAFSVLDKLIFYYPRMDKDTSGNPTEGLLTCDLSLAPPDYMTEELGLTRNLDAQSVLEYDYLSGLLFLTRCQWEKARAAFERVIAHPTRDGGVSKIMVEAYNKWLLVSLLVNGQTPHVPVYVGSYAKKAYETTGQPYHALSAHFDAFSAVKLKQEVEAHAQMWHEHRNTGLVQEVMAAHQKWQVLNLRNVFSKVTISQIRETTCSAETGNALPTDEEVERLVNGMIDSKMLNGVIVKPEGKPAYLEYLAEVQELSETEYKKEVAAAMKRLKELEAAYRTTNTRLSTNSHWVKQVIRQQKREKEVGGHVAAPYQQLDDEDLMTGITAGDEL